MQFATLVVGGIGLLVVVAGNRADASFRVLGYSALWVTVVAGTYLAVTAMLYLFARLFRSRRARRLFTFLTFQRAGQVAAGMALLANVSPPSASAQLPAGQVKSDSGSVGVTSLDTFLHRFGLDVEPPLSRMTPTYTVVSGDSFWRIAERQVRLVDPDADVRAVALYWLELVDVNLDQLVVAGNPDLLHVGQVLVLPAMPDTVN